MKTTTIIKLGLKSLAVAIGLVIIGAAAPVHAESDGGRGLIISPISESLGELDPGAEVTRKYEITNDSSSPMTYKIYATGYQVRDESYDAYFPDQGTYVQIARWIEFSETEGTLEPHAKKEIQYTVTVPQNAPGGSQYAAIMTETAPSSPGDTIVVAGRAGLLVSARISGETKKCAKIHNVSIPGFMFNPPISASSLVENCGNVDLNAKYVIKVYPLFSDEELYSTETRPEEKVVLPETKRFTSISWEKSPSMGVYRVEHIVTIGDKEEKKDGIIILCPIWLIIVFIALIGLIIFEIVSRTRKKQSD